MTQWQLRSLQTHPERVKTHESCVLEHHIAHGKSLLRTCIIAASVAFVRGCVHLLTFMNFLSSEPASSL